MDTNTWSQIHTVARRRYISHKKRNARLGLPLPIETDFVNALMKSHNEGFKCVYCNRPLAFSGDKKDLVSIDHAIPLTSGGSSAPDNLVISCVACNMFKGTMRGDTYRELIARINNPAFFERVINESYRGRVAAKIERMEDEL